jgi:hypothetical protein
MISSMADQHLLRPIHPNERLGLGYGRRNEQRREQVRELLEDYVDDATGQPFSFAAIADHLGLSRERVRQLALEVCGLRGMVRRLGKPGEKATAWLRGGRRKFVKEGSQSQ